MAKSQVILKNSGVLPLKADADILVAGASADSIWRAAGGWTLTWQGGSELGANRFPGATSIYKAIRQASGGKARYSADGSFTAKPDVAVVIFGEEPYAEFYGDRKNALLRDEEGLELLRGFKAQGIPTVAVLLSGRPLWLNREINAADAFVASWLPGSEGAGVADILFGQREASGRLSFSWPAGCSGQPVNGREGALFNVGYGLARGERGATTRLDESCTLLVEAPSADWFGNGRLADNVAASARGSKLPALRGEANGISARGVDRLRQEDAREIVFEPGASLTLAQTDGTGGDFLIAYSSNGRPAAPVTLTVGDTVIDITSQLAIADGKGWREMVITEACAPSLGDSITFTSQVPLTLRIASISRQDMPEGTECSF